MGIGAISDVADATVADASDINQYSAALRQDHVPRNASGIAANDSGSIGQSTLKWLKAHIASGYWTCGDIKPHHSYNGAAPIDNGWFPCDGTIINQTNYDAIHGVGAWTTYIGSSILDGKYAPDLLNGYITGVASTTKDGTASITNIGNTGNTINVDHFHAVSNHTHTETLHNHIWYDSKTASVEDISYDTNGDSVDINGGATVKDAGVFGINSTSGAAEALGDKFTAKNTSSSTGGSTPNTDSKLSGAQDIRPNSLEATYYVRII